MDQTDHEGHSVAADFTATLTTIDALIAARPALQGRRLFLRIDTEGMDAAVLAGAQGVLAAGQVAAVMVARSRSVDKDPARTEFLEALDDLSKGGFRLRRLPHEVLGGALVPFVFGHELCTIFTLAADFTPQRGYPAGNGSWLAPPRGPSTTLPRAARAAWTTMLRENKSSDCGRWADPAQLLPHAEARAKLIAPLIPPGSHVVDLGAGATVLAKLLKGRISYHAADLTLRAADGSCCDFNQDQWPDAPEEGYFDVAVALQLLEYLHNPDAVLRRLRDLAPRLILGYRPSDGGDDSDSRRAEGMFNDMDAAALRTALDSAGWTVHQEVAAEPWDPAAPLLIFQCRAD